jgi:predicted aminopeptidase
MDEIEHRKKLIQHHFENQDAMRCALLEKSKDELVDMVLEYRFKLGLVRSGERQAASKAARAATIDRHLKANQKKLRAKD